jgi:hypothetical protein
MAEEKNFFKTQGHEDPDWALERYISDTEREYEGAKIRGDKEQMDNAAAELARLGKKPTSSRPARAAGAEER